MSHAAAGRAAFAAAKVNLFLHVGPRATDGYHPVSSLIVFADVGDRLWLAPPDAPRLTLEGPFAGALSQESENLALKAAAAIAPGAKISVRLEKVLPVASGLAGGSADAAAVLRLLNARRRAPLEETALRALAARLGSDVAACLESRPVLASGRGESLSPAPALPPLHAVLVNPLTPSPTAAVYRAFDVGAAPTSAEAPSIPPRFAAAPELVDFLSRTRNDLEAPAITLAPQIEAVLAALKAAPETLLARISGSGATAFALCETAQAAQALAARLAARHGDWWVKACRLGGPWR